MLPAEDSWEIGAAETAALLRSDPGAIRLIDCREEDEFAICRIEGADLVPLSRFAEESARKLPPPGENDGEAGDPRPIVVYCHHGMRSLSATRFLRQRGHRRVWSLHGGIDAWSLEIDPRVPRY